MPVDEITDDPIHDIYVPERADPIETNQAIPADIQGALTRAVEHTNDPAWREALRAERQGEMTENGERLIDGLIGLKLMAYEDGRCLENGEEIDIFLASLSGDQQAKSLFETAIQIARSHDGTIRDQNRAQSVLPPESEQGERLSYNNFSIVHCTKFKPTIDHTTSRRRVKELYSETNRTRGTVHTSLNHVVESHMFGNWDEQPFVIVAPLDKVAEINGEPMSVITYDTWFAVKPGKGLQLPEEAILVCPGASRPVHELPGAQEIRYMTKGFTAEHLTQIYGECTDAQLAQVAKILGIEYQFRHRPVHFQDTGFVLLS